jgi:glucose/arabinose dehydrogenase
MNLVNRILSLSLIATLLLTPACSSGWTGNKISAPTATTATLPTTTIPAAVTLTTTTLPLADTPATTVIASHLEIPWSLVFLPDGSMVFTERSGRVRLIRASGELLAQPILTIADVSATGEGGLLGTTIHPSFATNHYIYFYYTYRAIGSNRNKVVRYTITGESLAEPHDILAGIPAGSIHDGGRIKFGPDGCLYITTGETGDSSLAQDKNSLAGKILRVTDEGQVPADNPFPGSPVYSYGNRNSEGLAWDDQGRLWATEHGPSGGIDGVAQDELNLIQPGLNYGWPTIKGAQTAPGLVSPVLQSGSDTWAPSGMAYFQGSLYFAALRGESLFKANLSTQPPTLTRYLQGQFGRLRDVVVGPDGMLYILTSNRDGRGSPTAQDDVIIRVNPAKLK